MRALENKIQTFSTLIEPSTNQTFESTTLQNTTQDHTFLLSSQNLYVINTQGQTLLALRSQLS